MPHYNFYWLWLSSLPSQYPISGWLYLYLMWLSTLNCRVLQEIPATLLQPHSTFRTHLSLPIACIVHMSITSKSTLFPNSDFTLVIASLWPMHVRQAVIKSLTGFPLNDVNNMRFPSIVLNWKLGAALVVFENDTTRAGPNNYNNDDNTFLEFRSTSGFDISQGSSRA